MKIIYKMVMILAIVFSWGKSYAQPIISLQPEATHQRIFMTTGLEPEWIVTMGYTHRVGTIGKAADLQVGGSVKLAPFIFSAGAWRANCITTAVWRMSDHWVSTIASQIYWAHDHNRAGIMDGLGFELRATPSRYGKQWIKGIDLGWHYTVLTHIQHSTETKDTFTERYLETNGGIHRPKDGWYGATASRFRLGFAAARKCSDHWALQLAVGSLVSFQKQGVLLGFSHAQFPFYLESVLQYVW